MKYIRTKNYDICKVINEGNHTLSYENSHVCGCLWKDTYKDQIQYADTIEELCDEFVWIRKNNVLGILPSLDNHKYDIKTAKKHLDKFEIYGAIWTEWGLKYVAKMNDKGELELL